MPFYFLIRKRFYSHRSHIDPDDIQSQKSHCLKELSYKLAEPQEELRLSLDVWKNSNVFEVIINVSERQNGRRPKGLKCFTSSPSMTFLPLKWERTRIHYEVASWMLPYQPTISPIREHSCSDYIKLAIILHNIVMDC